MLSIGSELKIIEITRLSLKVNSRRKNTIILRFSGNVEGISISIYRNGFNKEEKTVYQEDVFHLNSEYEELRLESEKKLDEIIEVLEELKKEC